MSEHNHQIIGTIYIFIIIVLTSVITSTYSCGADLYVLRSALPKGLVLDASQPSQLKVQHYTGFRTQLWQFVCGSSGSLNYTYIVNNYTDKVLDYSGDKLFLDTKADVWHQRWDLTSNGRISSLDQQGSFGYVVDVYGGNETAGTIVDLYEDNDSKSQEFTIFKKV